MPRRSSRRRLAFTALVTVLIVLGEFAFLSAVYLRAQPARQQRTLVAEYVGGVAVTTAGPAAAALAGATPRFLNLMRDQGASNGELSEIGTAAHAVAADPLSPTTLATLRTAAGHLQARVTAKVRTQDRQALYSYAVLLVLVSFGWAIWFRRLVSRHRRLQRRLTEAEAKEAGERRLGSLVRSSADVILVCSADTRISFATSASEPVLGRSSNDLVGRPLLDFVHPDDGDLFLDVVDSRHGEDQPIALRLRHADGRYLRLSGTLCNRLADPDIEGIVLTVRDISEQFELQQQLGYRAFHDTLTGLANRQLFTDRLTTTLEGAAGTASLVVAFCDLDDFKDINDTLGHAVGDDVLVEVARRLREGTWPGDTVARLGGDEFAILMQDTELAEAEQLAGDLLASLRRPLQIGGREFSTDASIGLAEIRPGETSAADALRNADVAMYLAKDRGKSGVAVYDEVAHHDVVTRMTVRTELQQAIPDNQFVLYFQPTVDLLSERIVGFEALVRWQHPERGLVVPDEFIPVAEQSGLIVPLGSWILAEACRATAAMPTGRGAPYVSVNVAAKQLEQPDFVDEVTGVLSSTGLGPERLVIEITESDVLADLDRIAPQLEQLRGRGIRIAVDDFGTGYSSLAYLSRLPVDVLKIDKVFVDKLMTSRQDASLARAIIELAQAMDFTTVAEGVEDLTQAEWLAAAACTYGQGYLWSRPVPFEQATRLLEAVESSAAAPVRAEAVPATRHRVATGSRRRTAATTSLPVPVGSADR